jgi:hypothetical protein
MKRPALGFILSSMVFICACVNSLADDKSLFQLFSLGDQSVDLKQLQLSLFNQRNGKCVAHSGFVGLNATFFAEFRSLLTHYVARNTDDNANGQLLDYLNSTVTSLTSLVSSLGLFISKSWFFLLIVRRLRDTLELDQRLNFAARRDGLAAKREPRLQPVRCKR